MKKEDTEKILINLYKEYLIIKEKNITTGFIQRGLFLGVGMGFLFSIGFLNKENNLIPLILVFFVYILHMNNIDNRHFKDVYMDFLKHVKENKIEHFEIKKLNWFQNWIYYKRKY